MNPSQSKRKQPNRKQYKLSSMQLKILQQLNKNPCILFEIYQNCTYGTTSSVNHCNSSMQRLMHRHLITIKGVAKINNDPRALYAITDAGREALQQHKTVEVPAQ